MKTKPTPQFILFDPATGQALKHDALARFEVKGRAWLSQARAVAVWLAEKQGVVTTDDVLEAVGYPPTMLHWNVIGAVFSGKDWQIVGYVPSKRASAHSRRIGQWRRRET